MQQLINDTFELDAMIFKNSERHSTQPHFHMHVMPSKGNTRKLIANFDSIDTHPVVSDEEISQIKKYLLHQL